jgi:hypothetical protein
MRTRHGCVTVGEQLRIAGHPSGRNRAVDRDAGLVDRDAGEDVGASSRLHGDESSVAVPEDFGRPSRIRQCMKVLALFVDGVRRSLGTARAASSSVHQVDLAGLGQGSPKAQVVLSCAQRTADDDDALPGTDGVITDGGSIRRGHSGRPRNRRRHLDRPFFFNRAGVSLPTPATPGAKCPSACRSPRSSAVSSRFVWRA